mmetsp:Transcript_457/g.900  ORF Transcript_457/g.900 Transcript_457/m.900 type:complete len:648 (-) Transcript_457:171-2114(-)
MLAFTAISMLAVVAHASSASSDSHGVLTNPETGTIIHPLIPHFAHLERRRRELHEKYGTELDTSLPPRPHTSRHSQTPNTQVISALRANNNKKNNNNNNDNDERNLQQQMGALYQGYGTHYIDLWVGSPTPQRQTVIVDTGSGVTAFPCEECKGCGDKYHTDNYFKESQSKTFAPLNCQECFRGYCASMGGEKKCRISMSYAEGSSWSAYEAKDLCYAGGPHDSALVMNGPMTNEEDSVVDHIDPVEASQFAFELAFGCQVSITGLFITQLADGIMGMENEKTAFWKQMHLKNAIPRPEFSLCFSRNNEAARDGTSAGAMTLGGVDPRLHMSPMVFAKNVKPSGFYAVHLKAVYLREGGGISAQTTQGDMANMHKLEMSESQLNQGNIIVDSGTTDTYFSNALAGPFKKVWKELTGENYGHIPIALTDQQLRDMPTIVLVMSGMDGDAVGDEPTGNPNDVAGYAGDVTELSANPRDVVIAIPASHYMEYDPDTSKYVARFYTEESSGSVIGANAMMGYDVFFDSARGRIGFAESDCDYVSLLLSEGMSVSVAPKDTKGKNGGKEGFAAEILDDMKNECSSAGCRGIAALFILGAVAIVIMGIRKTMARRRVIRQYQEAELEISDLALDSDSDDEGGYVDEPPMPQIT